MSDMHTFNRARCPTARPINISPGASGYTAPELKTAPARTGAQLAFVFPSRINNRLHWPDGRVTDLAGHPLKASA